MFEDYYFILVLQHSISSGALGSPGLLLSCFITTISLHNTILTMACLSTSTSLHLPYCIYRYKNEGDLGLVALSSRASQKTLGFAMKPKPLSSSFVLEQYRVITQTKGSKAQGRKIEIIKGLMNKSTGTLVFKFISRASECCMHETYMAILSCSRGGYCISLLMFSHCVLLSALTYALSPTPLHHITQTT